MGSSPKGDIKAKLTQSLEVKEEDIIYVFGLYTKFGGGRSTGLALVYDFLDAK
jgi:small subunit ribosomal protein S24e